MLFDLWMPLAGLRCRWHSKSTHRKEELSYCD